MKSPPAFQFYAADWLADENVTMMTLEEEGAYVRALAYCWREGSIPADQKRLSLLLKGASREVLATITLRFKPHPSDPQRLIHGRLDSERQKQQDWREKSSEAGIKSGKVRREKKSQAKPEIEVGSNMVDSVVEPDTNSSSSSSSSSSPSNERQKQKPSAKSKSSQVDERFGFFRQDFEKAYEFMNHIPAPWDGKEATSLSRWLNKNPTINREQWQCILRNRKISPINQKSELSRWMSTALAWLDGPADEWGKPLSNGGTNAKVPLGKAENSLDVFAESIRQDEYQSFTHEAGDLSPSEDGSSNPPTLRGDFSSTGRPSSPTNGDSPTGGDAKAGGSDRPALTW